jgi:uncharacterized protein involved in cysteine biosynthesis
MKQFMAVLDDAVFMRRAHGWLTIIWLAASPFIVIYLSDSIAFLVFVSVYAVVTGHWSSWQASRVEVKQDEVKIEKDKEDSTS